MAMAMIANNCQPLMCRFCIVPRPVWAAVYQPLKSGRAGCSSDSMRGNKSFGDGFDDLLMHFVDGEVAFYENDAIGLACRDFAVLMPDAAVEVLLLLLKAVFILAVACNLAIVASAGAVEAAFQRREQEQGEIGLEIAAD